MEHQLNGNDLESFEATDLAKEAKEQAKAYDLDIKAYQTQAQRLKNTFGEAGKALRRSYMQLFTTSKIGLGIQDTGMGRRESSVQSKFRSDLRIFYNAYPDPVKEPNERSENIWCPVLRAWIPPEWTTAAHIFPFADGQDTMDAIFGRKDIDGPELFSPRNGLLLTNVVEKLLDKGSLLIVPAIPDDPTAEEVEAWVKSEPRDFKVRLTNKKDPAMQKNLPFSEEKWSVLDGRMLAFRNDYRPRARYLYWHYCVTMLRKSWHDERKSPNLLRDELGRKYWATRGSYMRKTMLLAFVEEMGHEYEELLEGAETETEETEETEDVGAAVPELALLTANEAIRASNRKGEESEDSEDDSEAEAE